MTILDSRPAQPRPVTRPAGVPPPPPPRPNNPPVRPAGPAPRAALLPFVALGAGTALVLAAVSGLLLIWAAS